MNIGDAILYAPHADHALTRGPDGTYPWEMGWRNAKGEVETLTDKRATEILAVISRSPDPSASRKNLVLLRPKKLWLGTVTGINEDDTASLDVQSHHGGIILHMTNVTRDPAGLSPHSFHAVPNIKGA